MELEGSQSIVNESGLTHGIEFSNDGRMLFASTGESVFAWTYDAGSGTVSGDPKTVINGMNGTDHTTRTLLMSKKQPGSLLVSRGSGENLDLRAEDESSGISQIRAFDMTNIPDRPYSYHSSGTIIGWGLRNSVGVAEEPTTGGIFSVENSLDKMTRDGTDVHQNNPGEELNFHGFLNGSTDHQGGNYGYPDCFAIWDTDIPDVGTMSVGDQFPMEQNSTLNDTTCNDERVSPRLTWQAHTAPLDIKFTPDGTEAYVTFHGSWNRDEKVGYNLASVNFANGQPVEPTTSKKSLINILANPDISVCPDHCFRPAGVVLDSQGRLFMSSDSTGEIYVLAKGEMTAGGGGGGGSGTTPATDTNGSGIFRSYLGAAEGWCLGLILLAWLM